MKKLALLLLVLSMLVSVAAVTGYAGNVDPEMALTAEPTEMKRGEGETVQVTVNTSDTGAAFQWQYSKNNGTSWADLGTDIEGSQTKTLKFSARKEYDGYQYRCKLTSTSGVVSYSNPVKLVISYAPVITGWTPSYSAGHGESVELTVIAKGEGLTYRWQYSKNGGVSWADVGTGISGYNTSTLKFDADVKYSGYQYRCKVTSSSGESAYSPAATITVTGSPFITSWSTDITRGVGDTATFLVNADGIDITYQWQYSKDGNSWTNVGKSIEGYISSKLTFTAQLKYNNFKYRCKVTSSTGESIYSDPATLTVTNKPVITKYSTFPEVEEGDNVQIFIKASGVGLKYQWQYSKDGKTWSNVGKTITGAKTDTMTFTVSKKFDNYVYRCKVTSSTGDTVYSKEVTLKVTVKQTSSAPVITGYTTDITRNVGNTASFGVDATGSSLTYQWQYSKDGKTWANVGSGVDGSKTAKMTFAAALKYNGYKYRCKVTSGSGEFAYSPEVSLKVTNKPFIKSWSTDITCSKGGTASFYVKVDGVGLKYQWQYSADGNTWKNVGSSIESSKTNNLKFTATEKFNNYKYRCKVTSSTNEVTYSEAVTLTVK